MRRVFGSLVCLLVAVGCASTQDTRWYSLMRAGAEAYNVENPAKTEELWREALAEAEKSADERLAAQTLERLGRLYEAQARYAEAEQAFLRALTIREKISAPPGLVARGLTYLADLYRAQRRYGEAAPLLERARPLAEAAFGPRHHNTRSLVGLLANVYANDGKYADAEQLYKELVPSDFEVRAHAELPLFYEVRAHEELAELYEGEHRYLEAEPIRRRLVQISEKQGNPPDLVLQLRGYASLLRRMNRRAEAEDVEARAQRVASTLPNEPGRLPRIRFDEIQILTATAPEIRRTRPDNGFIEFAMTVTVRYVLRSADRAALQLSPVVFQSPGCVGTFRLAAGPFLPLDRGEGSLTVPVRWIVGPAEPGSKVNDDGYVTLQTALYSDQGTQQKRLIELFEWSRDHCYRFRAPNSG